MAEDGDRFSVDGGDCEETNNIVGKTATLKYSGSNTNTTLAEDVKENSSKIKKLTGILDYCTTVVGDQKSAQHWEDVESTGVSSEADQSSENDDTTDTEDPTTEAEDSEDSVFKEKVTTSEVLEESNRTRPEKCPQLNLTTNKITSKSWRRSGSDTRISEADEEHLSSAEESYDDDVAVDSQDGVKPVVEKLSIVDMDVVTKLAESKGVKLDDIDDTNVSEPIEITDINQFDNSEVTKLTALFELEKNKCTNISKSEDGINLRGKQKGYQVSCTINYELPPKSKLNSLPGQTFSEPLKMGKRDVPNEEGVSVDCKPPKRVKQSGSRVVKVPKRSKKSASSDGIQLDSSVESCDGCWVFGGEQCALKKLIYWQEPQKTALVFGTVFSFLLATCLYSVISVVSYTCLAVIAASTGLRLYAKVTNKSFDDVIGQLFDFNVSLSGENFHELTELTTASLILVTLHLKSVFLAEDLFATLKMACTLWYLTYVGGWFNGVTLIMITLVTVFTLPKAYLMNQQLIDGYVTLVTNGWANLINKRTESQIQIEHPLKEKLEGFLNKKEK